MEDSKHISSEISTFELLDRMHAITDEKYKLVSSLTTEVAREKWNQLDKEYKAIKAVVDRRQAEQRKELKEAGVI